MNSVTRKLGGLLDWIDARFPLSQTWNYHLAKYYAPKNFNNWYYTGSLALLIMAIMIISGIWLAMVYIPSAEQAFASVEFIMRDVEWGWLLRYIHAVGGSLFFIIVYLHIYRGMLYGSYKKPRELVWIVGMLIYFVLMGIGVTGYMLPWGQMSYWALQVVVSMSGAIPVFGDDLALWLRGDYVVSGVTLTRFYALHVCAFPLILIGLVVVHLIALHEVGSNNPDGIEIKANKDANGVPLDGIPFHPYYSVKDLVGFVVFLIIYSAIVFFAPDMYGWFLEGINFVPANPLVTPEHIVPNWYFTAYYAILRAIPDKLIGVIAMVLASSMFIFLPWLDRSPVKSIRYRGWKYRTALIAFTISFLALSWLGTQLATPLYVWMARFFTLVYFGFFFLMPFYTSTDNDKPVPDRIPSS
jgi:ubiquinol-cytochrome c reductase cytochrome b subunit